MDVGEKRNADGVECARARVPEKRRAGRAWHRRKRERAFGEHLANEAGLSGTESGTDGDFFLARSGTREKEVGKIGADDEHDDADSTGEDEECGAKTSTDMGGERSERGV